MTSNYGRSSSLSNIYFGWLDPGELRGCTFNKTTDHLWAYELHIWAGKNTLEDPDNVTIRLAIYETNSSKNPTNRIAYSDSITVSNVMTDASGGQDKSAAIVVSTGPLSSAVPLRDNTRYHLAALGTTGSLGHRMQAADLISADNKQFYVRSGLSQPPPNPFGSYSSSIEGHMTIWAVCDINVAPDVPANLVPSGSVNETAPTFTADFADDNENRGDYLNQFRIQVRRVSDGATFWDTTLTATNAEQTADAISRAYGGTTLVRGTAYEWRCQMSDYFDAWSDWSAWTAFTPANLGFVTLDSNPTGKIEDNTPDFEGRWTHQSATTMKTCMVRILNGAGTTVLQTGADYNIADVASSASPGTLFTIPWASSGLSDFAWGTSYQYQIRGYDGTQWSDWSSARAFNTNAAPSVPTNLDPANSQPLTAYPLLTCTATDADDTTGTGLVVKARIKDNVGAVLFTRSMTYNATTGKWEYQTTGTDLASYATYRWDAYAGDGTLWSGEQTVEANATKSSEATFIYAAGPTPTITSPTEGATITTAGLTVGWSVSGGTQAKYRVILYEDGTTDIVYDSGLTVSTATSYVIPSGYLRNGVSYDLVVIVEDTTPLTGQSAVRNITVDYVEPDAIQNFTALAVPIGNDPNGWTTANRLTWDTTTFGTDVWQMYVIKRSAASGVDAGQIILARISSPSQTSFTDYTPVAGVEYTYTMTQLILTGLDELESAAVTAMATASFGGVVLCDVSDPENLRSALRYTAERKHPREIEETIYKPLSGATPTTVRGRTYFWTADFEAKLVSDDWSTAQQKRLELETLDAAAGTLCYRDEKSRKYFATMPECTIIDQLGDWFMAALRLREQYYQEGTT